MTPLEPDSRVEIAAGSMQLQPVDDTTRCGAVAALGRNVAEGEFVWIARDAVTALPLAYVAIVTSAQTGTNEDPAIKSAPGLHGCDDDADAAAAVVSRYAHQVLGL